MFVVNNRGRRGGKSDLGCGSDVGLTAVSGLFRDRYSYLESFLCHRMKLECTSNLVTSNNSRETVLYGAFPASYNAIHFSSSRNSTQATVLTSEETCN